MYLKKAPSIKYVRKIFRKTNNSNPLIHTCAHQVRNINFLENFAYVLNGRPQRFNKKLQINLKVADSPLPSFLKSEKISFCLMVTSSTNRCKYQQPPRLISSLRGIATPFINTFHQTFHDKVVFCNKLSIEATN